ncbi:unnamed protein product [Sphenostylis stenocarpa]|uniref:Phosphoglycerate mutase n=1 Tax=Sphenostylis stenocarpa TaxID=92480 RepID=A0AA86TL31_9FABA|nr:unnamed protein product [Sphenostylis stenocarpa]
MWIAKNRYWVLRHGKSIPNERGLIVSSMVFSIPFKPYPILSIIFLIVHAIQSQENGTRPEFQLASDGVHQAQLAAQLFQKELEAKNIPLADIRICYSPFSRTRHTANVVATFFNLPLDGPQCMVIEDLRERYFGPSFELLSHDKVRHAQCQFLQLPTVFAIRHEKDPLVGPEGGESVKDVAGRLARAIATIESKFEGCAILVVSHGDPLQILQTIMHASNQDKEPTCKDLASILKEVQVAPILSQHRKYALQTGELRNLELLLKRTTLREAVQPHFIPTLKPA